MWIDFVIYSGEEREFNLIQIQKAFLAFALNFGDATEKLSLDNIKHEITDEYLTAQWRNMLLEVKVKLDKNSDNL